MAPIHLLLSVHPLVSWPTLVLATTTFVLGCRHGFDWDHISAITDLSGAAAASPPSPGLRAQGRRLGLALWYCVGHGSVIVLFGVAVGILGLHLPAAVDRVFESVVGATLVALGAFVLWQLGRDRGNYRYAGRVRLVVGTVRRAWSRARRRGAGPAEPLADLSPRAAFAVGVVHGGGAETPTQVLLFAGAASSGSHAAVALLLVAFVAGMILADLGIAAGWLAGLLGARRAPRVHLALGGFTGISSLAVGALFVAGRAGALPTLFGG